MPTRRDGGARWGSAPATLPGFGHALRRWASRRPMRSRPAAAAYGAVLAACLAAGALGAGATAAVAAAGWVLAGSFAWCSEELLALDARRRASAHDASGAVSVAGFRLVRPPVYLPEADRDALEAAAYLHDRVRRVWLRGSGASGGRWAYEVGVRDLLRRWASNAGLPVRAGDRAGRRLVELGLLRRVPLCQAVRWELAQPTLAEALAAYEAQHWARRRVFRFDLGRDPRHGAQRPPERG